MTQPDEADWSQARYLDHAYVTVDVAPPPAGGGTTGLTVRATTDAGTRIDRVVLERRSPRENFPPLEGRKVLT